MRASRRAGGCAGGSSSARAAAMAPPAKGDGPERWLAEGFAKLTEDGGVVKRVDEAGEEAEVSSRLEERGRG